MNKKNKILISACLLGNKVRFDGKDNLIDNDLIHRLNRQGRLVSVCPEIEGGLPIPRPPAEIQDKFPLRITGINGEDVTPQFLAGAERAIEIAERENCCCALLKSRSPSCGNLEVYDGNFTGTIKAGSGATADELMRNGLPVYNERQLDQFIEFIELLDSSEPELGLRAS
ncbi:DUF523 domain-containing protein [Amphritea japonica]|uniref:Purine nucleoside phosphorylase n=1 Tax=Amphritea japonica ATCC BAA-1530 TaxID=1278309 RepID=A0A7R6PDB5_9GAMM|nr:DUF523 domain-containing protein [Amphritea japonica]BBB26021.1 conserved hypothetical protein [Amphritea japonica ATCC BAA-1530]